ncbi:SurA N-terminal domain-containing protein [Thiosocius teredinicola]|uniref:SurA N-terminal domain-containing protein n=1 Tax=Thiosocius teredinicola TaxID=1973002 RepID=UPI000990AEC6
MLQAIREKAQGWIAWAIVILISIPFALWGIQEYLGVGGEPEVAEVDGDAITERMLDQRVRDFRDRMRNQLGEAYRADLFQEGVLKEQVLDAMIDEMVLVNSARSWNLRTSDAQAYSFISSVPSFQRDGQFDQQMYQAAVRNRGMSEAGFEQTVRQDMAVAQIRNGIEATVFATQNDVNTMLRLYEQKRKLRFVRVPADAFRADVKIDADAVRAYYEKHPAQYRVPEQVKLNYLLLDESTLGGLVEVNENALMEYYEGHKSEFSAAETPQAIDQAKKKAEQLLQQIRDGADFAELAKQNSDDPGSSENGGDLGWVERGMMVPQFEDAAFALDAGAVSDVVKTDFGYHIIQAVEIRDEKRSLRHILVAAKGNADDTEFADVRAQVETAYRKFEAENLYFDYAERLAETAYENPSTLGPAAEALGIAVQSTDWLSRESPLPAQLDSPKVIDAAFADDVLNEGNNSQLLEIGPQRAVVLRVVEHAPETVKPFEDNRVEIEQDFVNAQASEAAAQAGQQALEALKSGQETLEQLVSSRQWEAKEPGLVGRNHADVPAEVLDEAFSLQPPAEGAAAFGGVVSAEGDYFVVAVDAVEYGNPDKLTETEKPMLDAQIGRKVATAQMQDLINSLRARAAIDIKLKEE